MDIDPEYAPAYIGKLCAKLNVRYEHRLGNYEKPISGHSDFQKAIRFADAEYKAMIKEYDVKIRERLQQKKEHEIIERLQQKEEHEFRERRYAELVQIKSKTSTEEGFRNLAALFLKMDGYRDSVRLAQECDSIYKELKKLEERRKERPRIEQEQRDRKANGTAKRPAYLGTLFGGVLGAIIGFFVFIILISSTSTIAGPELLAGAFVSAFACVFPGVIIGRKYEKYVTILFFTGLITLVIVGVLGYCYNHGNGVTKDQTEGGELWRKAAEQEDESAKAILKDIFKIMGY